ncbi:MAG: T9SS type A sorting domain-containing protein [Bacteroidales bacterium]|nr:T9SS type A sorting domain-containing protein [Bacteroidales bacterium]
MRTKLLFLSLLTLATSLLLAQTSWVSPGVWTSGAPDAATNAIIDFDYSENANFNCNDLTINAGSNFVIQPGIYITVNGNLVNNGDFLAASTNLGDGSLLIDGTISGSGSFSVERYLSAGQWHLVTSPVFGATASVFNGIWLRAYDESLNLYGDYIVPDATPMPVGQGFIAWTNSSETRTFSGSLNNGNVGPLALQLTGIPDINRGWNLIGNPYVSAIDWNAASGWTKTNVANAVYVYNGIQYASYVGGTSVNGGSQFISSGQGFFVQSTDAVSSISMNNEVRVHNSVHFMKDQTEPLNNIRISIEGNSLSDESVITIRENAIDTYDFNLDAAKIKGDENAPQMYLLKQDAELSIASVASIESVYEMPVQIEYPENGEYLISWCNTLEMSNDLVLFDIVEGVEIPVNTPYTLFATTDEQIDRFKFAEMSLNIPQNQSVRYVYDNNIVRFLGNTEDVSSEVFGINGQKLMSSKSLQLDLNNLAKGLYILKYSCGSNTIVNKIVVK